MISRLSTLLPAFCALMFAWLELAVKNKENNTQCGRYITDGVKGVAPFGCAPNDQDKNKSKR